jgi:CRP/FNR family transcriptional regulator, cyclic AMP receptor protein
MSLATEAELIRRVPVFSAIGPDKQKLLCFSSERLTFEPGQVMFREGDAADAAYVVIDGTVEITVATPGGPLLVNTLGESDVVGETAIFGDVPRTATATAKTRLEALRVCKDLFLDLVRDNADAAMQINRILATRLANTTARLSAAAA